MCMLRAIPKNNETRQPTIARGGMVQWFERLPTEQEDSGSQFSDFILRPTEN